MGSIDKELPKNRKNPSGQAWMQELTGGGQPQGGGVMQQMLPVLNQLLGHHGGKSTRLNMDGTLKDMNAPSGLDWLEAHGPDRASVQARRERLAQELRPEGGLSWMAQQGAQSVEAQKQLQQMMPQSKMEVTSRWGGDAVGDTKVATRNGAPVGFATNTPQAQMLHQFSPVDFAKMLNAAQPPTAPYEPGSTPQLGDARMPINAFVPQFNPQNTDNMYVRDRAGVRAREQARQKHNTYTEQVQPQPMDYVSALGEQLDTAGQQQGNMLADLFGYSDKLPAIKPHELPRAHAGPPLAAMQPPAAPSSASQGIWDSPLGWLLQSLNPKNLSGLTSVPY